MNAVRRVCRTLAVAVLLWKFRRALHKRDVTTMKDSLGPGLALLLGWMALDSSLPTAWLRAESTESVASNVIVSEPVHERREKSPYVWRIGTPRSLDDLK